MKKAFLDYYRCPAQVASFSLAPQRQMDSGSAKQSVSLEQVEHGTKRVEDAVRQLKEEARIAGSCCSLPFDPTEMAEVLRRERYLVPVRKTGWKAVIRKVYYALRPAFPVRLRRHLQRAWLKGWESATFPRWPVDRTVEEMFEELMRLSLTASGEARIPFIWFWPEGSSSCGMMTHDVETDAGLRFAGQLMDMNDSVGIKSSFQLIPEARYTVTRQILAGIQGRGFEVNVHDLKHDGHLFDDRESFAISAAKINKYAAQFASEGFRSAILYRNQEWYDALSVSYDMSVPNVGHLDPQRGGCCTVMPYFIGDVLELPVTATQDYTLFHVLETYSLDLWREQIRLIMERHGMVSFIVHPDYLNTPQARTAYLGLLNHLARLRAESGMWIALPGEVNRWWRERSEMHLVKQEKSGGVAGWRIEGPGAERATIAYATLKDEKVCYEFA